VIGVIGSYKIAKEILAKVENYVNNYLKLTFNSEKTSIVDFLKESFNFLGFTIHSPVSRKGNKPFETLIANGKTITRRKKTRPIVNMNIEKVLKKLANNGFIRKRVSHAEHNKLIYRGTFKGNLINLDHPDIIRFYNSVLRGILNYYSFAKNRSVLT
jgi:hypothetical protein